MVEIIFIADIGQQMMTIDMARKKNILNMIVLKLDLHYT